MRPYQIYVSDQSKRNPCLQRLCKFLADPCPNRTECRVKSLDFTLNSNAPVVKDQNINALPSLLSPSSDDNHLQGRILIIEDITKDVIESVGSSLGVDPLFFAAYIHAPWREIDSQTPDIATLPSRARFLNFTTIQYHRTIVLQEAPKSTQGLLRNANVDRKVVILPPIRDKRIALVQHCCSVLRSKQGGKWLYIALVDPPLRNTYIQVQSGKQMPNPVSLPSELFLGGYEDFLDPPPFCSQREFKYSLTRLGLFDDLPYYWERQQPTCFDPQHPGLLSFAYIPSKIAAAEWMGFVAAINYSIREYEYAIDLPELSQKLDALKSDWSSLQSWVRRLISSNHKITSVIQFIEKQQGFDGHQHYEDLIKDYEYIKSTIVQYGQRLENTPPVITSFLQIADIRRSSEEAANVTKLTYLALVFVPLSSMCGLFGMTSDFAPGRPRSWIFFVVTVTLSLIVFSILRLHMIALYWRDIKSVFSSPRRSQLSRRGQLAGLETI